MSEDIIQEQEHSAIFGPFMMIMAALCFSVGGIILKFIPWNPLAINGVRNVIAMIVVIIYVRLSHHPLRFNKTVLFGSISYVCTTSLFTLANKLTTAGNAIILQYTLPIWIIIMMFLFFGSKPSKTDLVTVGVVLLGIGCFFYDSLSSGHVLGDFVAVMAGIFYGGLFILNQFEDGDAISSTLIGQIISGIFLAPLVVKETEFSAPVLIAVVVLGFIQVGLAYVFFCIGTKYTHPLMASLTAAIEPILNPLFVAIFWGEILTPLSLLGGAIVIVAVAVYNILKINQVEDV